MVRPQALVRTAGLRRLVLAHGLAAVEHGRGAPALGGRAAAGTGKLCQVVEGWLSVHCHCGNTNIGGGVRQSGFFVDTPPFTPACEISLERV